MKPHHKQTTGTDFRLNRLVLWTVTSKYLNIILTCASSYYTYKVPIYFNLYLGTSGSTDVLSWIIVTVIIHRLYCQVSINYPGSIIVTV